MLRLIGPPTFTWHYRLPEPGITWNYRFETIQRCIVFQVPFDAATGKVIERRLSARPGLRRRMDVRRARVAPHVKSSVRPRASLSRAALSPAIAAPPTEPC